MIRTTSHATNTTLLYSPHRYLLRWLECRSLNNGSLIIAKQGRRRSAIAICGCLAFIFFYCCPGVCAQQFQAVNALASDADSHTFVASNLPANPDPAKIRIGPGDLLELSVFDTPELTQLVRISDNGDAPLTLLGAVHLAGRTPTDAQSLIETRLRTGGFLLDPHVSLMIREYGTQGISVVGEVNKPGICSVVGAHNLLDVISMAGGTTRFAAHYATIKHRRSEGILTASLSNEPGELLATNIELQPGDTVIIPKAGIVYVIGDVGHPGGFVIQTNGKITLLQAVALAAGINRTAAAGSTRLIRKTDAGGFEESTVNLKRLLKGKSADIALRPEDIVYIPPSTSKSVLEHAPSLAQSAAAAAVYQAVP
jgi:polysaccharide export outer membrane protein